MRIPTWLTPLSRRASAPEDGAREDVIDNPSHWMLSSLDLTEGLDVVELSGPLPAFPDTVPAFQIPRA
ncbi:MAG TPA: hypothetical protein VFQ20_06650 [Burkholderiaceae bacterium]|nr:hypothetical protein [Burkholderiaceae bacterium]